MVQMLGWVFDILSIVIFNGIFVIIISTIDCNNDVGTFCLFNANSWGNRKWSYQHENEISTYSASVQNIVWLSQFMEYMDVCENLKCKTNMS